MLRGGMGSQLADENIEWGFMPDLQSAAASLEVHSYMDPERFCR